MSDAVQEAVVFATAEGLAWYYLCSLKMALSLHGLGIKMTRGAPSPYTIAKSYGYKGTRAAIYQQVMDDVASHTVPATLVEALRKRRGEG